MGFANYQQRELVLRPYLNYSQKKTVTKLGVINGTTENRSPTSVRNLCKSKWHWRRYVALAYPDFCDELATFEQFGASADHFFVKNRH